MFFFAVCTRVCWGLEMYVEIKTWTGRGGADQRRNKESYCKRAGI